MILSFLKLLKLKHLAILIGIALIGYAFYAFNKIKDLNYENERVQSNFSNAIKIKDLETSIFRIKDEHELQLVLDQNQDMADLVEKSEIEKKRILNLYYQKVTRVDTITKEFDMSGMVDSIRNNIDVTRVWTDSTKGLSLKGSLSYSNGKLTHITDFRETIVKLALIKKEGRRKQIKWLLNLRLGKRPTSFEPVVDSGKVEVTIIEKEE